MIEKVCEKVWKIRSDSNVYFLDLDKKIIIDTGRMDHKQSIKNSLKRLIDPKKINAVFFTHFHFDHIGNMDLFPKAWFYASKEEIDWFKKDSQMTVLDYLTIKHFDIDKVKPIVKKEMFGLEIIKTPGHTRGSICLWYPQAKVLFSGDTLFFEGFGRIDLPTSAPELSDNSIKKLKKYNNYRFLCPGHDY